MLFPLLPSLDPCLTMTSTLMLCSRHIQPLTLPSICNEPLDLSIFTCVVFSVWNSLLFLSSNKLLTYPLRLKWNVTSSGEPPLPFASLSFCASSLYFIFICKRYLCQSADYLFYIAAIPTKTGTHGVFSRYSFNKNIYKYAAQYLN